MSHPVKNRTRFSHSAILICSACEIQCGSFSAKKRHRANPLFDEASKKSASSAQRFNFRAKAILEEKTLRPGGVDLSETNCMVGQRFSGVSKIEEERQ